MEIWKDINGFEGLYQVSNLGNVKRLAGVVLMKNGLTRTVREKILKPAKCGNKKYGGYLFVNLYKEGKKIPKYIHRLVADAFVPNPYNLPQVNHKDEDKTNNVVDNLEFCSVLSNLTYNDRHIKAGIKHAKPILQFTKDGEFVREWQSARIIEKQTGWSAGNISWACLGHRKSAYGFVWKFAS